MRTKILNAEFSFPSLQWSGISVYAKDFIKCLLAADPKKRYTAEQALKHPWIQNTVPITNKFNLRSSMESFVIQRKSLKESDSMVIN